LGAQLKQNFFCILNGIGAGAL